MTTDHAQAAFHHWLSLAQNGLDLVEATRLAASPDCIMHAQNGDVGGRELIETQMAQAARLYPDLVMEVDEVFFSEDRFMMQVTLDGTTPALPIGPPPTKFSALGAVMLRVNSRSEVIERWQYLSPGAVLAFPKRPGAPPPPPPEITPGTEEQARALCADWARAATGLELITRVDSTTAYDCYVHATNGDRGGIDLFEEQWRAVLSALPDLTIEVEGTMFSEDRFVMQFMLGGTHRGRLGIAPPTGRRLQSTGALVGRVDAEGRAAEIWIYISPMVGLLFPPSTPRTS